MSLRPETRTEVPSSTAAVARAAFPRGNPYLRLRDALGTVFSDAQFAPLFPSRGQPAEVPWRLALVTVLQFAENLSDRRAAEAVRGRVDWKYLLGLELADPGFDASVLSEFRTRLVTGGAEALLLDGAVPGAQAAGRPRSAAHRQHACARSRASPQPPGLRDRDAAGGPERFSSCGTRVAAYPRRPGLGRALRQARCGLASRKWRALSMKEEVSDARTEEAFHAGV